MAKIPRQKVVSKKHLARLEKEQLQRRYLIIGTVVIAVVVLVVLGYGILDQTVLRANRAVAKVDGQSIPLKDFQTRVKFNRVQLINQYQQMVQLAQAFGQDPNTGYFAQQIQQIQAELDPTGTNTLGTNVLNQMIDEKLIETEAKNAGVTVTDAEVNKRMEDFFGYYPNGTPTVAPTETEVVTPTLNPTTLALVTTPTLTPAPTETATATATPGGVTPTPVPLTPEPTVTPGPTATPMTEQGYKDAIKKYVDSMSQYGVTESYLRNLFRADLLRTKMMDKITADVKPEEDQVWARHILVADEASAKAVEERLKKGEDFCKVAKEVSTDTSNKDTCGDLGWFGKGKMVAEFDAAAFKLPIGQISDPVKTQFGYHIIQVVGHEVRPLTASELQNAKQTQFNDWLTKLSADAKRVQKFDNVWQSQVPTEPALGAVPQ